MGDANPGRSDSSEALDALLSEQTSEAEAVRKRFHRTMLWRLRTGRRSPDLQTAVEMATLSGGRVAADGWAAKAEKGAA